MNIDYKAGKSEISTKRGRGRVLPHAHQAKNKIVPQTEKNTLFFL
jgi:hypothetical protein